MNKNILHIINGIKQGGAETIVKTLLEKFDYSVFCLRKDKDIKTTKKIFFGTTSKNYKFNIKVLLKLLDTIKKENIEILHVHLANAILYGIIVKTLKPKIKLIYHEHGEIYSNKKLKYFLKIFKNKVDLFIAVSKSCKKKIIEKVNIDDKKITILYNFIDLDKFNIDKITWNIKEEKKKLNIKDNGFVIGFVGRLAKVKGCEYLIKALTYLDFPYKVLIAGNGPLKTNLKKLSKKLNIEDKVIFLGHIQDIRLIYSLLDSIVVPSISESFGLVILEAQSFKIPIIASNIPAINEIIKDEENGLFFEQENEKDLAKKIKILYTDINLRKKITKNSIKNIDKYNIENYILNLKNIYNNI